MIIKLRKRNHCVLCARDLPRGSQAVANHDHDNEVSCLPCEEEYVETVERVRKGLLRAFPLIVRNIERGVLDPESFGVGTGYTITEALLDIQSSEAPEGHRPAATKRDIDLADELWEDLRVD